MEESRSSKRGYGRNWKKWVLISLAVGAVIYGVVYVALQSGGGSGGGLYG